MPTVESIAANVARQAELEARCIIAARSAVEDVYDSSRHAPKLSSCMKSVAEAHAVLSELHPSHPVRAEWTAKLATASLDLVIAAGHALKSGKAL